MTATGARNRCWARSPAAPGDAVAVSTEPRGPPGPAPAPGDARDICRRPARPPPIEQCAPPWGPLLLAASLASRAKRSRRLPNPTGPPQDPEQAPPGRERGRRAPTYAPRGLLGVPWQAPVPRLRGQSPLASAAVDPGPAAWPARKPTPSSTTRTKQCSSCGPSGASRETDPTSRARTARSRGAAEMKLYVCARSRERAQRLAPAKPCRCRLWNQQEQALVASAETAHDPWRRAFSRLDDRASYS